MPPYTQVAFNGGMTLLMGLLIGLERQHSQRAEEPLFAGVRTFPIIALTGFLSALIARAGLPWMLPVALAGVSAVAVAAYFATAQGKHKGATTELAAILTFVLGALAGFDFTILAATFAVITTLLLSVKAPLHRFAERIQEDEMYAILKFGIVSVIVLPLLPNRSFGPFAVLNPRLIWWMVVLISALSMLGYVLMRLLGARQGIVVTGVLGGLASSTAATFELSHKAQEGQRSLASYFALGIVIASTIMFGRQWLIALVIDPDLAKALVVPIALPTAAGIGIALFLWLKREARGSAALQVKNPMDLGSAIKFGLIFAVVLFMSKAAHEYYGASGVYVSGALAGIVDVDAFTVSAARLVQESVLSSRTANAAILLAGAMNTLVKGGIAALLGGEGLRRIIIPLFALLSLAAVVSCIVVAFG